MVESIAHVEWIQRNVFNVGGSSIVSFSDHFFLFLFVVMEKRVWWISVGRVVLQTPRFWESLIGVDYYKSLFDEVSITIVSRVATSSQQKKSFVKKLQNDIAIHSNPFANRSSWRSVSMRCTLILVICSCANRSPTESDYLFANKLLCMSS